MAEEPSPFPGATLIPRAKRPGSAEGDASSTTKIAPADFSSQDFTFDVSKPQPHDVVVRDSHDNEVKRIHVDQKALEELRAHPAIGPIVIKRNMDGSSTAVTTYESMIKGKKPSEYEEAAKTAELAHPPAGGSTPVAALPDPERVNVLPAGLPIDIRAVHHVIRELGIGSPKVKVNVSGPFGKMGIPCSRVYRNDSFLILVQHSEDGCFNELPVSGEEKLEVQTPEGKTSCYFPGIAFKFAAEGTIFITVLLIAG